MMSLRASIGDHSAVDWGRGPPRNRNATENATDLSVDSSSANGTTVSNSDSGTGPASRYDPKAISRIVDITDLVDDNSDTDSDDDIVGHSSAKGGVIGTKDSIITTKGYMKSGSKSSERYGPGGIGFRLAATQVFLLICLVAVIGAASVAIRYAVLIADKYPMGGENIIMSSVGEFSEQNLLEIAERVNIACSETELDQDMSECQNLCTGSICCFESGEYNCQMDETKACAVYAGCEALVNGDLIYGSNSPA